MNEIPLSPPSIPSDIRQSLCLASFLGYQSLVPNQVTKHPSVTSSEAMSVGPLWVPRPQDWLYHGPEQ